MICPWPFTARITVGQWCLRRIGESLGNIEKVRRSTCEESYAEDRVAGDQKVRADTVSSKSQGDPNRTSKVVLVTFSSPSHDAAQAGVREADIAGNRHEDIVPTTFPQDFRCCRSSSAEQE